MQNQQYVYTKKCISNYTVSYGVIQAVQDSCDSIDFFKISANKYGFYLADVAGIDGPNIIRKLQQMINQHCLATMDMQKATALDPAAIVGKVNTEMYVQHLGHYVTLIYGILDIDTNILNYTVAGYYPNPILIENANQSRYLLSKGTPLGIVSGDIFENYTVEIPSQGAVVVFSDGIMRFYKPDSGKLQDDELLKLVCSSVNKGKVELAGILEKLHLTYSTPVVDDIVILTIQRS